MPELPDVTLYVEALRARLIGQTLRRLRFASPFVLRSTSPDPEELVGRSVESVDRRGKRIVIALAGDDFVVIHLMIAGRLEWAAAGARIPGKIGLAAFDFANGSLLLREASPKKRAAVHLVRGAAALARLHAPGLEVLEADLTSFRAVLARENHTLKRALTDPRLFSGIGNAYSDEILHAAELSPLKLTRRLTDADSARLFDACRATLALWVDRLREECGGAFPSKVTAFREEMAVHGKYGKPCPRCGASVQRIVYAENEANYCARCQTGGKLLADRSLSRLLRNEWPRTLEELEESKSHKSQESQKSQKSPLRGASGGAETGAAGGAATGAEAGAATGAEAGSATGAATGAETGAETGAATGAVTGEVTGAETGAVTDAEIGAAATPTDQTETASRRRPRRPRSAR